MDNWIDDYLIDWHTGSELKIYRDFEVISFIGIKQNWIYTIDHLLDIDLQALVAKQTATETFNKLLRLIPNDEPVYITSTPLGAHLNNSYFYKLALPLRIDYAIQVGLGVARSIHQPSDYCLYPIETTLAHTDEVDQKAIDLLRLRLYVQLIRGKQAIDRQLQQLWMQNKAFIQQLLFADVDDTMSRFSQLFQREYHR